MDIKTKNIKKISIVLISGVLALGIAAYTYLSYRKKYNEQLNELLMITDIRRYGSLYTEEFETKVKDIYENYTFRTNGQIKKLVDEISKELETGECIKIVLPEQLSYDEMKIDVLNTIDNSEDFGVTKIFVYTDRNLGEYINKNMTYVDCTVFTYDLNNKLEIDQDAKLMVNDGSAGVEDKKAYDLVFSSPINLSSLGGSKKYSLISNRFDPTMLRECLFLNLAKEMNMPYSSDCEFVEVWFDGKYNGTYLLAETVDVSKNSVDIDANNGDFLGEYDHSRHIENYNYFYTDNGFRFTVKNPYEFDNETFDCYQGIFTKLDDVIFSNDYEEIKEFVDVDGFAKMLLLNEFAKTYGFANKYTNIYYKDSIIFVGPAWDFDISSGNVSTEREGYYSNIDVEEYPNVVGISYEGFADWYSDPLFNKLYEYDEFKQLVKQYFNEYGTYMQNIYSDGGVIDSLLNQYGDLINNNYSSTGAAWTTKQEYYNLEPLDTYEANVDYLKYWLENRYRVLNNEIN